MSGKTPQSKGEVRVIAPSSSWERSDEAYYARATNRLQEAGLQVSFGTYVKTGGRFQTAPIEKRLADLHDAFRDPNVVVILALTGGWSANELLPGIDWELVKSNPKPLSGFSDITVLHNAIYAKTGNTSLLGPNFSSLGSRSNFEYSLQNLLAVLEKQQPLRLRRSQQWFDWKTKPRKAQPWKVIQEGSARGTALGGNLESFYLLQGTEYMPYFDKDIILFVETDDEAGTSCVKEFDRRLESISQQLGARKHIKGLVVGRFQPSSKVTMPDVLDIITRKFPGVPAIARVDFGHTKPMLTLPIGGTINLTSKKGNISLELVEY